jgi:molybdenum cofactor cytidylyltransferase
MGEWKPLLPWGGSTIIETVIGTVVAAGLRPIVVTGFRGDELGQALGLKEGILLVHNPAWEGGMLGSVVVGAEAVESEAFFVMPADMPGIGPRPFELLAAARKDRRPASPRDDETLFAAFEGRAGHPVLVPSSLRPALRKLDPTGRLRGFLMSLSWRLVETDEQSVLEDIDTAEDYRARLRSSPVRGFP